MVDADDLLLKGLANDGLIEGCFCLLKDVAADSSEKLEVVPAHII